MEARGIEAPRLKTMHALGRVVDTPPVLFRIRCADDLPEAFRLRKEALGISNETLESICSMSAGQVDKYLGASRLLGIGAMALDEFLKGLAVDLVMVANPEKLKLLEADLQPRAESHVRTRHKIAKASVRRVMTELAHKSIERQRASGDHVRNARKGGLARWAGVSAAERRKLARKAGKASAAARWANRPAPNAAIAEIV
jgi:hypothetical protein